MITFLVDLCNKEDHDKAREEVHYLIYDDYLLVREWTPNFHAMSNSIQKVAAYMDT